MLVELTQQVSARVALAEAQVREAVKALAEEQVSAETKAGFLTALAAKGETTDEIAAFARALSALSLHPPVDEQTRARTILDVCGTGGDRLNTFNISTTVALIVASADVTVAKHGNRAITSQSGSADVLEALGIPTDLSPEEVARSLQQHHFAFLFAPRFHPAFKHIGPARKLCAERGQKTIFNFLGPLLNPVRPSAQLIGVPRAALCVSMARVLQSLGVQRGMVVCGEVKMASGEIAYLDELSTLGESTMAEFYQDHAFAQSQMSPQHFPIQNAQLADLAGGDRQVNAEIIRSILKGTERGPKRDAVLLNCGAALFVAGKTRSISEGWDLAADLIDSGKAFKKLEDVASDR